MEMVKSLNGLMKVKQMPGPHLYAGIAGERFPGKAVGKIVPSMIAKIQLVVNFQHEFHKNPQYRVFQFREP